MATRASGYALAHVNLALTRMQALHEIKPMLYPLGTG